METYTTIVVNNVINIFGVIFIVYAVTFVLEKMANFINNIFSDIKIEGGWLSDLKNFGFNIRKKD